MKTTKILIVFLIPIVLAGCGYTTSTVKSAGISSIYVPMFKNETYEHNVHVTVTDAVINELILDGNLRLVKHKEADTILQGQVVRYKMEPLGYDKNNDVEQYRMVVTAKVVFKNLKKDEIIWAQTIDGSTAYYTSGRLAMSEKAAADKAIENLARNIVSEVINFW
ncbi:LptE family protein [bacterium]|nr:LptE family protein [bacterium]